MTSSYRHNAREEVLRARYEHAKKTLEEMARQDGGYMLCQHEKNITDTKRQAKP